MTNIKHLCQWNLGENESEMVLFNILNNCINFESKGTIYMLDYVNS